MSFTTLFILQFVFFYIYGIVSFIKNVSKNSQQHQSVQQSKSRTSPTTQLADIVSKPEVRKHNASARNTGQPFTSMDNINVLLYIGAFLIMVAVGIFVGYSYESLSGTVKTFLVALFSLSFYGSGLAFYTRTKKIKPAGLTFATIGLVSFPLIGLAAYNFVYGQSYAHEIWFATSVGSFLLYVISVVVLRKIYIAYLMAFTSLSIFESATSLFNVPLYYYTWVMTITSLVYILIAKVKILPLDLRQSYSNTGNAILLFGVMFSLAMTPQYGLEQASINIFLAALNFLISNFITDKTEERNMFFGLSVLLLPLSTYLYLHSKHIDTDTKALVLAGIGLAYVTCMELLKTRWKNDPRLTTLSTVGGLGVLATSVLVAEKPGMFSAYLAAGGLVNFYLFYRTKLMIHHVAYIGVVLYLPNTVFRSVVKPAFDDVWMAIVYFFLTIILIGSRFVSMKINKDSRFTSVAAYFISSFVVLVWAMISDNTLLFFCMLLLIGAVLFGLSYIEKTPSIIIFSIVFIYAAMVQMIKLANLEINSYPLVISFTAIMLYGLGHMFDKERNQMLRLSGVGGSYIGPLSSGGVYRPEIQQIGSLAVAAGLSFAEAQKLNSSLFRYIAAGVGVLTLQWFYMYLEVRETQIYTVTWAIYFGTLAFLVHRKNIINARDVLTGISLAFLTIPLAYDALNDQQYALILIIESILLVLCGIAIKYKLVRVWGTYALIITVLYQMRDFFLGLPTWAVFGLLGIAFLGGAVFLLSKRKD